MVDFGAGTGHLGLLLAWLRPDCTVVLVERKPFSAHHGRKRIAALGLLNCEFYCGGAEEYTALIDGGLPADSLDDTGMALRERRLSLGVAMHACGPLTDAALSLCVRHSAKFVLCPCCYGGLRAAELERPQSAHFTAAEALGETVILLHPPLPFAGVSIAMVRGCQQNDSLADG